MNVLDRTSGQTFQFPDDATDDDIITAMGAGQTQQQSFNPLAQQFMGGLGNIAQQLIQPEPASTLPNIGGGAMVGLTPQQAQWTLGQAQQANVTSMEERMRKQQAIQQGIEAEKDRAQELKFKQAELKNRLNQMKFEKELAEFKIQEENLTKTIEAEEKTRQAEIEAQNKWVNVPAGGGIFKPYSGEMLEGPEKQFAPPAPQEPPRVMQRTYTGKGEDGNYYQFTESFDPYTGVPLATVQSEYPVAPPGGGRGEEPDRGMSDYQRSQTINSYAKSMFEAQSEAAIMPGNPAYRTPEQIYVEAQNIVDRMSGSRGGAQTVESEPAGGIIDGPTPEQEEEMRILRQSGVNVIFDYNTGRLIGTGGGR